MDTFSDGLSSSLMQIVRTGTRVGTARRQVPEQSRLPSGARLAATMVYQVLPEVSVELAHWREMAQRIPEQSLRRQALASLRSKRFHCQGGAVLALLGGANWRNCVTFIVALQTISDYLDNLSDRNGQHTATSLRRLHLAMLDAADPPAPDGRQRGPFDYYTLYPWREDGGYLACLVDVCSQFVRRYVDPDLRRTGRQLAAMYRCLQAAKHSPLSERLPRLQAWCESRLIAQPDAIGAPGIPRPQRTQAAECTAIPRVTGDGPDGLHWPEFAAACGSTLGLFAAYCDAAGRGEFETDKRPADHRDCCGSPVEQVEPGKPLAAVPASPSSQALLAAYFPWISSLHIMLDYLIDREEDLAGGDLNLTACYETPDIVEVRLPWLVSRARQAALGLPGDGFHASVVDGLLGLYLSDPKVDQCGLRPVAAKLLAAGGSGAETLYTICGGLRRAGLA